MRRIQSPQGRPVADDATVVSLVVDRNGVVRVDESASDDVGYGRNLAHRLTRSLEESPVADREGCHSRTTWASYRQMIRSNSLRYETTRPRELNIWSYIAVSPGRKEPKRGC
jgi:hypothetical protein